MVYGATPIHISSSVFLEKKGLCLNDGVWNLHYHNKLASEYRCIFGPLALLSALAVKALGTRASVGLG